MQQYNLIKQKHLDCMLFFRLGDFYEMFYEDAIEAASILGITLTKRAQKDEDIPMSGVPYHTAEHYIAKLVKAGKKIAICEQIENEVDQTLKIIKRDVVRIITPGTLTDDNLLDAKRNNFLAALHIENFTVSAAVFDLSTNEFFIENFETGVLKDALEKIDPSEILMTQELLARFPEYDLWKNMITITQELNKQTATNSLLSFFNLHSAESLNYKTADLISTAMIVEYIKLTQKSAIENMQGSIKLPKYKGEQKELILDKFTRRNLEITKTLQNQHKGSLLWLLDQTHTAQGARALFHCLSNPITDIDILNDRYNKIEFFIQHKDKLEKIRQILKEIPDFERMLSKIALKRASPILLHNLAIGINKLLVACEIINIAMPRNDSVIQEILNAILPETEKWNIKQGYDEELDSWKIFENEVDEQIQALQEEYKIKTKVANLRIKFHSNFGYIVEINSSQKDKLSFEFLFRQDLKNAARYTTADLENINLKLAESTEWIESREKEIFENLSKKLLEIGQDINQYALVSAQLDLFSNFAKLAIENNYTKPIITDQNDFDIKEGRHPILDKLLKDQGKQFVANDCNLSKCVMFMTGPNMAGKSTYLRQQALIILLAHIGMYVPAHSAKIGIVDHMFSRIGTNDNLMEGNSTFMMEMIEIALTLNQATNKSFIVFDEVGRGTSTEEGMAIAQAILEYLVKDLKARSIFATHYLSLQTIQHENLQQKMMEIIENPIHFTHKILDGVAKKSYAINVAQIAGMPSKIVERAKEILN